MENHEIDYRNVLSGRSITIVFKDVGDASMESPETQTGYELGKTVHATVTDDHSGKVGHLFLVHPKFDVNSSLNVDSFGKLSASDTKGDFVFDVMGNPDLNITLSDVYALAGKDDTPVKAYVDPVALQLFETATTVRTDENSKAEILQEVDEAIAMDIA